VNIRFYLHNIGEALFFLCAAGIVSSIVRWRSAKRKDFLIAVDLIMFGIMLREYAVWRYDAFSWADDSIPLYITTVSRAFMLSGGALFIRAGLKDRFGEWVTPALIAAAFVIAFTVL
jgi:hypothetical protein